MAQGTLALFDEFAESIGDGRIDLDTDTFKVAFVTLQVGGTPTIAKTDAVPTWGAGGTTNLSTSEVSAGGGYTANGESLTSVTWAQTSGVAKFDAADLTWTSAASGDPATIKTAVIYSDTATNKDCVGFVDMTADGTTAISLLAGDISITWGAGGIFTCTNP
jgi:hypothetical protein